MNAKAVKAIRKVERPRPLKLITQTVEVEKKPLNELLSDLEALHVSINNFNFDDSTSPDITKICNILKARGKELDQNVKKVMDDYFVTFRSASREDRLDELSRMKLLEIIELRAMKWDVNENIANYYEKRIAGLQGLEGVVDQTPVPQPYTPHIPLPNHQDLSPSTCVSLAPGEVLKSSGKFPKPTKIPGKNYFKDEVIIRNSDSGKVTPGARDRLVQITGPHEESISHAKTLVEDTIRRNASPVREKTSNLLIDNSDPLRPDQDDYHPKKGLLHSYSTGDASVGEYTLRINAGEDTITLSGSNLQILNMAKIALAAFFEGQQDLQEREQRIHPHLSHGELVNFQNMAFDGRSGQHMPHRFSRNGLHRSSSWMSSNESQTSASSLDSTSDDETYKQNKGFNQLNESQPPGSRKSSTSGNVNLNLEQSQYLIQAPMSSNHDLSIRFPFDASVQQDIEPSIPPPGPPKKIIYCREDMLKYSKSPLCRYTPVFPDDAIKNYGFMLRNSNASQTAISPTPHDSKSSSEERNKT